MTQRTYEMIESFEENRRRGRGITSIRSKGTEESPWRYKVPENVEVCDGLMRHELNRTRTEFWSRQIKTEDEGRNGMMMMMKGSGLTRREQKEEGVHLRKEKEKRETDDDGRGLTSHQTATIKESHFRESLLHHQHQHHTVNCCSSTPSLPNPHQPKLTPWNRSRESDPPPTPPPVGPSVHPLVDPPLDPLACPSACPSLPSFIHHHDNSFSRCLSSPLNGFSSSIHHQLDPSHPLCVHFFPSHSLGSLPIGRDSLPSGHKQTITKSDPKCVSSSSSLCLQIHCSHPFNCFHQSEVNRVNNLTDNSIKCLPSSSPFIGSNGSGSVLFSGLVASRRKLFTPHFLRSTIKSEHSTANQSNYSSKLKQQPVINSNINSINHPSVSTSSTRKFFSSPIPSTLNPVITNNQSGKYQHPQSLDQCYPLIKMVADTDSNPVNGEGMAMTMNHSNREMTMFMDNMNGHHYENINVYHSNQHNHHPVTNGKSVNPYLSKDRPNSANSYSLESNSSGGTTTDSSSGNISSPLSGLNGVDDAHGDELQYGPGIVDKLRSKFLQYSLQTSSRSNGYNRSVKRCSSLENLADRDSSSSSPLFHHSTCNGNSYGLRKGPNYVKYHQHNNLTSNNSNMAHNHNQMNHHNNYSSQSNHTKGNNQNGVDSGIDINGGGASTIISKGSINGRTIQSLCSTPPTTSPEKRLQGENRNFCSRTTNGFTSSSSSGRNYRKYEQQPIKSNHYHHLNQHSSIYLNHNHRYNCDGLLKRAQSVETLLLESRNSTKSTTSSTSSSTFTNCNNLSNTTTTIPSISTSTVTANCNNSNSTRLTSNNLNLNSISSSSISSNSENSETLSSSTNQQQHQQQSRWQSTNNTNTISSVNSPPPPPPQTTTINKVNCVAQVSNHLVAKQQDSVDSVLNTTSTITTTSSSSASTTTSTNSKRMSLEDANIVGVDILAPSECKLKPSASFIYSPISSNSTLTSDKKMVGDITVSINNNNCDLIGSRKLVEDELPKPDTVKNCKKIFETNSVSPTPLTGPLSPSSSSNQSTSPPSNDNSGNTNNNNNHHHHNNNNSSNESDSRNGGQAYRKGGLYGSSNSAIRRKPPVLSSIEKKITVNKVTINNNNNTANNNHNSRLINGSGTSSSPTSPALPPKPPFLINKKSPLNGELNHVNVNNNYLSAIKPMGKQITPNESNKNKINSGKSTTTTINGQSKSGSSNNLVKSKPLMPSQSTAKPKSVKSDESSPSSSQSSSSSSPLLSPSSSFIPPSPLNGLNKSHSNGDDGKGEDTIDGCPGSQQSPRISTVNGSSPSIDKDMGKPLINKINSDKKPSTVSTTSSMITNKPIANIKPIQLDLNEDHHHRWKSSINKKPNSDAKTSSSSSNFSSLGVTTNLITKEQSNNELNCLPSDTKLTSSPSTPSSESNNNLNNEKNKVNYNKSPANNKRIEVDEKPNNSMITLDNSIHGSRSYSSPSTPTISSLTSAISSKSSPTSGTTMIFDFRGKNVKANVAVHSPPFSVVRPASNVGGRSDDNEDDYNYTGSTEIPKPSGIVFKGENIIIDGGSLLIKRNKKLNISFDDKASTFEYPSEASFIEDSMTTNFGSSSTSQQLPNSGESSSVIQQQSTNGSSLKNNTTLGGAFSGGLASYKPTFLSSESIPFQLGVSRVIKGESDNMKSFNGDIVDINESNQSADDDENDETSFNMIKPAEPSETASWSTSSTALDLLF